jgi:hypothetical protein
LTPSAPDHLAVLRRRAHQRAPARLAEQDEEQAEHDRPDGDQEQLVGGEAVAEQDDEAPEPRRAGAELVLRAPDRERDVLDHQHYPEGGEELEQLRGLVDVPEDDDLDRDAQEPDPESGEGDAAPEAQGVGRAESVDERPGEVGAQHVEGAVREVHDPGDAEDDRQAGRDQEQGRGRGEAVQGLGEDEVDHGGARPVLARRRRDFTANSAHNFVLRA